MKKIALAAMLAASMQLIGCATCQRHAVTCGFLVGAAIVGAAAAVGATGHSHHHYDDGTWVRPYKTGPYIIVKTGE